MLLKDLRDKLNSIPEEQLQSTAIFHDPGTGAAFLIDGLKNLDADNDKLSTVSWAVSDGHIYIEGV